MGKEQFAEERFFLKDDIRQQVDFRTTAQSRGIPPPPLQQPTPEGAQRLDLPGIEKVKALGRLSLSAAIERRQSHRQFDAKPLTLEELTFLLWATQGVKRILNPATALRTTPSAGARHPFETYLVVSRIKGMKPGLYRYLPFDHQLVQLSRDSGLHLKAAHACLGQMWLADAAVTFFWTVVPARGEWRYDRAAHKVMAIDAGHVGQNLYLACEAIGCGTCTVGAYDQAAVDALLGVDGDEEFAVYIAPVGKQAKD